MSCILLVYGKLGLCTKKLKERHILRAAHGRSAKVLAKR
jgi:hypothetical protein